MSKIKVAKHTPGPWIYYPNADYFLIDGGPGQTRGIAKTYNEDNAALIAAAPELLEALYVALPYIEDALLDDAFKPGAVNKSIEQVRTAISKAEGGK